MSTAPVVVDSIVVTGLVDGRLVARHRMTGRSLWQLPFSGAEFRAERLLNVGDMVIVPHFLLHGVDIRTGARRWTFGGGGSSAGVLTPTIAGDTVFVAGYTGGTAAALNARTGEVLWRREFEYTVYHPSVTSDLALYPLRRIAGPSFLVALDRGTGEERWRVQVPDSQGVGNGIISGGAVLGDRTVLGTSHGMVLAVRLSDGVLLWTAGGDGEMNRAYFSQPLAWQGISVMLRTADGVFEGRSPVDGQLLWSTALGSSVMYSPRPCGEYFCHAAGRTLVLDKGGNVLWADGGGSGAIYLSNVTVAPDGIMYAGVYYNAPQRGYVRAFRSGVSIGSHGR
ncbi:MAG: PQQ-like beta-propeller repeat protein [Gemmatimonadaceae bacterium]|nr:PQQ-like beta-propeller repeat protein [Gemmatimonadaceae bacterium]